MKHVLLVSTFLLIFLTSNFVKSESCNNISQQVHVSAVYPTADELPENLLRFYIYFDRPMSTENTFSHIYLANENSKRIEGVFLENKFNLWSPDRTRLTLLFDPGRVKTGLVAHNAFGRALQLGETYDLIVDAGKINGLNCSSIYIKKFSVLAADYNKPNVLKWMISKPETNTKQSINIDFAGIMDHVSLAFRIRVLNKKNEIVSGSIDLANNEKKWIFTPNTKWVKGDEYTLSIDPVLEDIAGNRITGLFDQPSLAAEEKLREKIFIPLNFRGE